MSLVVQYLNLYAMKRSEVTYKYNWTGGYDRDGQMYEFMHYNTDTPEEMDTWLSLIENLGRRIAL